MFKSPNAQDLPQTNSKRTIGGNTVEMGISTVHHQNGIN